MQGHVDLDSSREELSGCSLEFALGRVGEGRLLEATGDRSPREMASGRAPSPLSRWRWCEVTESGLYGVSRSTLSFLLRGKCSQIISA